MVVLHLALLAGCALEVLVLHRPFIPALGWSMLALVAAAQGLRWWCIATLGRQWNTRVVVIPGAARITGGPYRWLSHPNYVAVILEGWPFRSSTPAWLTALAFTTLNAVLLSTRVAVENSALRGWHERPHRRRRRTCGLATAIHAARAGLEVTVVESGARARSTRPAGGVDAAHLAPPRLLGITPYGKPFRGITYLDRTRRRQARFPTEPVEGSAHSAVRRPFTTPQQAQGPNRLG